MFRLAFVFTALAIPSLVSAQNSLIQGAQLDQNQSTNGSSSPQTSTLLQPAGGDNGSSMQSTGTNGVTQSGDQSALQRPANSEEAKLFIQGDVDSKEDPSSGGILDLPMIIALGLLVFCLSLGGWLWWRSRKISLMYRGSPLATAQSEENVSANSSAESNQPVASKTKKTAKKAKKRKTGRKSK